MSTPTMLLTPEELSNLEEINRLLHEANAHSLEQDGHCKSAEGAISLHFGNHWDRLNEEDRKSPSMSIYSYLLGPHRNHDFDSITQALDVVRVWHKNEMDREGDGWDWEDEDDPYIDIEREREAKAREMWALLDQIHEDMEREEETP